MKFRNLATAALCCSSLLALKAAAHATSSSSSSSSPSLPRMKDLLVVGLEEVEPEYAKFQGKMYAGRIPMDNGDRHGELMFWFFAADETADPDSVTIWLNGGPGCSSFNCGVMFENSPVTVPLRPAGYCCTRPDEPFVYNDNAWTKATNMLYVEQPVGVGYSEGGPDPEVEADLAGDFYVFVQNWFKVFKPYQGSKLFVVGESYAGMYAPSIAYKIFKEMEVYDESNENDDLYINLAGVGLGNGWADALVQGPATIDYGYWHGMFDEHTRQALHAEWDHCINSGNDHPEPEPFHKVNAPDDCAMMMANLFAAGKGLWDVNIHGPNTYDVTTWDSYPVILGGDSSIENFFNDPRVKEKLHAPMDVKWLGCIPGAGRRLQEGRRMLKLLDNDQPMSTVPYLAEMLDRGVRVLIYNGDRDLSTCAQGSEMLLNGMQWNGADEWFTKQRGLWVNPNTKDQMPAGFAKSHKGLDFVVIYNSGHLVPYNQPENALDLITRFVKNESFSDIPLPSFDFYKKTKNPGTSLANGMYGLLQQQWQAQQEDDDEKPAMGSVQHTLWIVVTVLISFVAGIFASAYWSGRKGYERI